MGIVSTILHLILVVHYSYGIYVYLFGLTAPPEVEKIRSSFGGPFKYLTFINMLLQNGYFMLALINDLFGSETKEVRKAKKLQKTRDFLFTTVVFSVGAFVSVSFWFLWHINRELIFPKIFDTFFPNWLNHNIHSTPVFGVLAELWVSPHGYPTPTTGFFTVAAVIFLYMLWVCVIAYFSGYWVYPILHQLPIIGKAAFMVGMGILLYIFYVTGEALNSKIWGISAPEKKASRKSR